MAEDNTPKGDTDISFFQKIGKGFKKSDSQSKYVAVYVGIGFIVAFLFMASLAPQIGEKLGTLSVKKETQKSEAASQPAPTPRLIPAGAKNPPCTVAGQTGPSGYGDSDGNGYIDNKDAELVVKAITGKPEGNIVQKGGERFENADLNNDGQITAVDALLIQRFQAGYIHTFEKVCILR